MKRFGIVLTLFVLGLFALPTLADQCADQKGALVEEAKKLQAEINQYNSQCGGTRSKSEYALHNCRQWGERLDQWNASLDQRFKELAKRCK